MPSVYTIEGASPSRKRKKRRRSGKQTAQQRRFAAAAKRCGNQGLNRREFRACMRDELKG